MLRLRVSRPNQAAGCFLALVLLVSTRLTAQTPDSSATLSQYTVAGDWLRLLPMDRAVDVLSLQPGVTTTSEGELLLRGGQPGDAAIYLDGVPILSAFRSRPFFGLSRFQVLESRLSLSPNVVDSVSVLTGPLPADMGNGRSGAVAFFTRDGGDRLRAGLDYETDEPFGSGHSFGVNRVLGNVEGALGRQVTFFVGGLLEGQRAVGTGFDSQEAPIFVSAGLDTTVAVPSTFGDPSADTTFVPVYNLAVSRGRCEDFGGSTNPDIASNFGLDCQGAHTPQSAVSTYEVAGKIGYHFGSGQLSLLALLDQHQNRNFDYGTIYNPPGISGNRATSRVLLLSWRQQLGGSAELPLLLHANLSFQQDREHSGPLSSEGEQSTLDPFGGFLISPLDLRFDFDNFPVDDELIRNYRTNTVGSRRTPYDLENPAQYFEIDRWRNNAYGLYNRDAIAPVIFPESGGPTGLLTLYDEQRTIGTAGISWQPGASYRVSAGGEFTRYSISGYSSFLTDLSFSNMYLEHPISGALYLEALLRHAGATLSAGARYDFYSSRARRAADFPRISSHPEYDPADPDAFFTDDQLFPEDKSHGYVSPHIQASVPVAPRTVFRGGYALQAQASDFRDLLQGINTDVSVTFPGYVFGTDLDFERTSQFELGLRHALNEGLTIDLAVYTRNLHDGVIPRLTPLFDPLRGNSQNINLLVNALNQRARGIDLKLERRGTLVSGWLGYSYLDATVRATTSLGGAESDIPSATSRPHSVTAALGVDLPQDWKGGTLAGTIFGNVELGALFRFSSGTPYTRCTGDLSTLSPDLCETVFTTTLNQSRLPAVKQLDLRLAKRFGPGGRFAGYLDARNVLNFRNVLAVFARTGTTDNPAEREANWQADSADYANEAERNGDYRSDGSIDLGVGQLNPAAGCGAWADVVGNPAAPNCVYLIRAEERFGNGDHLFDLVEQRRASEALYQVVRGPQELTGPPRRIRIGLEATF